MVSNDDNSSESETAAPKKLIERAFGARNRNKLIDLYFKECVEPITPETAWRHVYRLLLWIDPTTGLSHCYESDKAQPGAAWYARSLAFHDWLSLQLNVEPKKLAGEIDWLFLRATADLAESSLRRNARRTLIAAKQRSKYSNRDLPQPGSDAELSSIIGALLEPFLASSPPEDVWRSVTTEARQFLSIQNKRKNLVGEGFEDVLAQVIRRACDLPDQSVRVRAPLRDLPGFNPPRRGGKDNRVDVAVVRPAMRTIVSAKWSVRADREKQLRAEYDEYVNSEADNQRFEYVFVTNEFDPARLVRACEALSGINPIFNAVVHVNPEGVVAAFGGVSSRSASDRSRRQVIEYIRTGRIIGLQQWLESLQRGDA